MTPSSVWIIIVLLVVLGLVLTTIKEPEILKEIKRRYRVIQGGLPADERWKTLKKSNVIFTGTGGYDGAGSNVNKGYEIYICLDGNDVNSAMYVILHELSHMTVDEYDHSENFWINFKDLKRIASQLGVYRPDKQKYYCGQIVNDPSETDVQSKKQLRPLGQIQSCL